MHPVQTHTMDLRFFLLIVFSHLRDSIAAGKFLLVLMLPFSARILHKQDTVWVQILASVLRASSVLRVSSVLRASLVFRASAEVLRFW